MKKINKHFYLYEDTINGIKKYAEKNKMKASDVVEMLWAEFNEKKAGECENKIEGIADAVKEEYIPCLEELKALSQSIEEKTTEAVVLIKNLIYITENKKLQEERKDENSIGADLKQISENLKQIEEVLKKK